MSTIDVLALCLVGIVFIEFFVWTLVPDVLITLAETLYEHPLLNQILHAGGALVVLWLLVPTVAVETIMAVSMFVALVAGLFAAPFAREIIPTVRRIVHRERIWPHLIVAWFIVLSLSVWTVGSVFNLY